jgi:hypothetical protein
MAPDRHLINVDLPAPLSPNDGQHLSGVELQGSLRPGPTTRPNTLTRSSPQGPEARVPFLVAGHAFTRLIHWSTETATMTSTPMANTW